MIILMVIVMMMIKTILLSINYFKTFSPTILKDEIIHCTNVLMGDVTWCPVMHAHPGSRVTLRKTPGYPDMRKQTVEVGLRGGFA